jgi:hypothetical protein
MNGSVSCTVRAPRRAAAAALAIAAGFASHAAAQSPVTACDSAGIGSTHPEGGGPPVTITSVSTGTAVSGATAVRHCLVEVLVPQAINIWVGLPMGGEWNGRWQSPGGGGCAGSVSVPTSALLGRYAGATTDSGHSGGCGSFGCIDDCAGNDASNPGAPDVPLQIDFANRSEHLMAVIGRQLVNRSITHASCEPSNGTCLTPTEALAIDHMREGPVSCSNGHPGASCPVRDVATRELVDKGNTRLRYPGTRGTALNALGGASPLPIAVAQPRAIGCTSIGRGTGACWTTTTSCSSSATQSPASARSWRRTIQTCRRSGIAAERS